MSERQQNNSIEWAPALKAIALEMGALALELAAAGEVKVEIKPDGSKVTGIDKQLNQLLIKRSQEVFPGTAIWSEEGSTDQYGALEAIAGRSLVLGDPIDGTDKLVKALERGDMSDCFSTVMLSVFPPDETLPKASVVYAPFLPAQPIYWADESGAYLEENTGNIQRLRVPKEGPTELSGVETYKISRWNGCVPSMTNMHNMLPNAADNRNVLRLTAVAEGSVDLSIFPGPNSNLHDIIPPLDIARRAGATTMALDGRPFEELLSGPVPGVVAARNRKLAEQAISYLGVTKMNG